MSQKSGKSFREEMNELELLEREEEIRREERDRRRSLHEQQEAENTSVVEETASENGETGDGVIEDPSLSLNWESTTADGYYRNNLRRMAELNRMSGIHQANGREGPSVGDPPAQAQAPQIELQDLFRLMEGLHKKIDNLTERQNGDKDECIARHAVVREELSAQVTKQNQELSQKIDRKLVTVREVIAENQSPINNLHREKIASLQTQITDINENLEVVGQTHAQISYSVDKNTARIKKCEERLKQTSSQGHTSTFCGGLNTSKAYVTAQKPPIFKGEPMERPMNYLKELRNFCQATEIEGEDVKCVINLSLKNTALDWWHVVESNVSNLEEFTRKFQARYWNRDKQDHVKRKLEFGTYFVDNQHLTKAEYATRIIGNVRELSEQISDRDTIRRLAKHFDEEIHSAITIRGVSTFEELLELLESIDGAGPVNAAMPYNRMNGPGKNENRDQNLQQADRNEQSNDGRDPDAQYTQRNPGNGQNMGQNRFNQGGNRRGFNNGRQNRRQYFQDGNNRQNWGDSRQQPQEGNRGQQGYPENNGQQTQWQGAPRTEQDAGFKQETQNNAVSSSTFSNQNFQFPKPNGSTGTIPKTTSGNA